MPKKEPVDALAELLAELDTWRQEAKAAEKRAGDLSAKGIPVMKQLGIKQLRFTNHADRTRTATLSEPEVTTLDEEGLLAALKPAQRKLIERVSIDRVALSDAIDTGKIRAELVAKFFDTNPGTPRITIR